MISFKNVSPCENLLSLYPAIGVERSRKSGHKDKVLCFLTQSCPADAEVSRHAFDRLRNTLRVLNRCHFELFVVDCSLHFNLNTFSSTLILVSRLSYHVQIGSFICVYSKGFSSKNAVLAPVKKHFFDGLSALSLSPFGLPDDKQHKETAHSGRSVTPDEPGQTNKRVKGYGP